jgi:hypothetical protein
MDVVRYFEYSEESLSHAVQIRVLLLDVKHDVMKVGTGSSLEKLAEIN